MQKDNKDTHSEGQRKGENEIERTTIFIKSSLEEQHKIERILQWNFIYF